MYQLSHVNGITLDTDTLGRVKLEPTDDLLEQTYTGTDGSPIDVDNRSLPAINVENISLNPNVVISRTIPGYFG